MLNIILLTAAIVLTLLALRIPASKEGAKKDPYHPYYEKFRCLRIMKWGCAGSVITMGTLAANAILLRPTPLTLLGALGFFALCLYVATRQADRIKKNIISKQEVDSIASIITTHSSGLPIGLWLKRAAQDWPPVLLEVSIDDYNLPAKEAPKELIALVEGSLHQIEPSQKKELKSHLKELGIIHPIDVEGANASPKLLDFFETLLLH